MLTGSSHQLCRALTGLAVGDEGPRSRSPAGRPADRIAVGTGLLQPAASSGRRGTSARTSVRTTTVARDDAEGVSAAGRRRTPPSRSVDAGSGSATTHRATTCPDHCVRPHSSASRTAGVSEELRTRPGHRSRDKFRDLGVATMFRPRGCSSRWPSTARQHRPSLAYQAGVRWRVTRVSGGRLAGFTMGVLSRLPVL